MDRYFIYKYIHLLGMMLSFYAYGMMLGKEKLDKAKGLYMAHGTGLFLLLLGGGGLHAVLKVGMQPWVIIKMVLWVLLASLSIWLKKKPEAKVKITWTLIGIGISAIYLGVFKSMHF